MATDEEAGELFGRWRVTPARRLTFFLGVDFALVAISALAAALLRFDGSLPPGTSREYAAGALSMGFLTVACALGLGAYRAAWSYFGLRDIARVGAAVLAATALALLGILALRGAGVSPTPSLGAAIIQAPIAFCAVSGFRLSKRAARLMLRGASLPSYGQRTLIIGAGAEGDQVLKSILETPDDAPFHVVGIVDDDPLARGTSIHGVRVLGPIAELERHLVATKAEVVIICIRRADRALVQHIMRTTRDVGIRKVRIVPSLTELVDAKISLASTRAVSLDDLLGRDPVQIDLESVQGMLSGKTALVTGGAGTIGSELCRQIARFGVRKLVVVDVDETRLHDLALELAHVAPDVQVVQALVDVRSRGALDALFAEHQVNVVYHAAAYKHVPMMEKWPLSALDVNVLGTANVATSAQQHGVERFVLVSTDKAVEPSSIMGASKRLAELVVFGTPRKGMRIEAVRFGNVLGSRGSVLPTFEAQLRRGGPLTVTHPEVERYFMMTSEAVQLVLQASVMGSDREVFVLDMGKPIRILDVAREFVRLNGLEPGRDIEIKITGLRPGEKLSEVLHYDHEPLRSTAHPRIFQTSVHVAPQHAATLAAARELVETGDHEAARRYFRDTFPSLSGATDARTDAALVRP